VLVNLNDRSDPKSMGKFGCWAFVPYRAVGQQSLLVLNQCTVREEWVQCTPAMVSIIHYTPGALRSTPLITRVPGTRRFSISILMAYRDRLRRRATSIRETKRLHVISYSVA